MWTWIGSNNAVNTDVNSKIYLLYGAKYNTCIECIETYVIATFDTQIAADLEADKLNIKYELTGKGRLLDDEQTHFPYYVIESILNKVPDDPLASIEELQ